MPVISISKKLYILKNLNTYFNILADFTKAFLARVQSICILFMLDHKATLLGLVQLAWILIGNGMCTKD